MNSLKLDFCLKGKRTYVHGTDIYDKIIEMIISSNPKCKPHSIDMSINSVSIKQLEAVLMDYENLTKDEQVKVKFSFFCNSKKYVYVLKERDEEIDCRYEYHEEKVKENSSVDVNSKEIVLDSKVGFSTIEVIVAMQKVLLEELYSDVEGKWYFTRLQLDKPIDRDDYNSILISFQRNFNYKLVKSIINIDGEERGSIFFSLVK